MERLMSTETRLSRDGNCEELKGKKVQVINT